MKDILSAYLPPVYGNESIPVVETLILLICNITLGRQPLYELGQWVRSIDPNCFGLPVEKLNDDRFARALDKLYLADRASLMTEIVVKMIEEVDLELPRIHNDSTTVKAYGKIPGKTNTGLELSRGNSKDHRPDLKQLVFSLSISSDGAVPVHYKTYSGNRTDDTTHIETWTTVSKITSKHDFIYVADCKVCTSNQLDYIVGKGGRVITTVPNTWKEVMRFKEELRLEKKGKKCIWRKKIPGHWGEVEYYSLFCGDYRTEKAGYRIYWYHSSEKRKNDVLSRECKLQKAESTLLAMLPKLNKKKLKMREKIEKRIEEILKKYKVKELLKISLTEVKQSYRVQIGRGRPGPKTKYKKCVEMIYSLVWERNKEALRGEKNVDGIFPLLTTDDSLSAKEVLRAYKYQPRLEKRFTQFKSVHEAAPLLFKKIERVEGIMFLFFLSLMIQAIIEREVRLKMKQWGIKTLSIYPESREAYHPTTSKILDTFDGISSYQVRMGQTTKEFRDSLTKIQKQILNLLGISSDYYWGRSAVVDETSKKRDFNLQKTGY
ncbi:MAG: IS1634 family transposase [Deltaproteobacteria bacterium]|nr:IS1634 family transposase [Deltaproteobacteria bacterium]